MKKNAISIDGIQRRAIRVPRRTAIQSSKLKSNFPLKTFSYPGTLKQISTIIATMVVTLLLSVVATKGLAEYNKNQDIKPELPITETAQESLNQAITVNESPNTPALNDYVLNSPDEVHLPKENLVLPDPLQKRKEFLQKYLSSKNSVLADHVDALSEQSQWKLIVAIARAESSFCKRHLVHNCWGIGGAWNLRNYSNYDQAIADVNRILEQHYISAGLNSPKKIVKKWVGHQSDDWEAAVEQELNTLKNVD